MDNERYSLRKMFVSPSYALFIGMTMTISDHSKQFNEDFSFLVQKKTKNTQNVIIRRMTEQEKRHSAKSTHRIGGYIVDLNKTIRSTAIRHSFT